MRFKTYVRLIYASDETLIGPIARVSRGQDYNFDLVNPELSRKTIRNCVLRGHDSVLEFADLCVLITCPIFVARQLMRYRMASYLERSLRYNAPMESDLHLSDIFKKHEEKCKVVYDDLQYHLNESKEDARVVLPLSSATQFVMKANMREWLHIFEQRLTPYAQAETRAVVQQVYKIAEEKFPTVIQSYEERNENQL